MFHPQLHRSFISVRNFCCCCLYSISISFAESSTEGPKWISDKLRLCCALRVKKKSKEEKGKLRKKKIHFLARDSIFLSSFFFIHSKFFSSSSSSLVLCCEKCERRKCGDLENVNSWKKRRKKNSYRHRFVVWLRTRESTEKTRSKASDKGKKTQQEREEWRKSIFSPLPEKIIRSMKQKITFTSVFKFFLSCSDIPMCNFVSIFLDWSEGDAGHRTHKTE